MGKRTDLPQRVRVIKIYKGINTSNFGSLEDIIKDSKNISPPVHDFKKKAGKDKGVAEPEHDHILTLSAVANVSNFLLRYVIKIIIVRNNCIYC